MYELLIAIPISIIYVGFIFYMGKRIKYSRTLFLPRCSYYKKLFDTSKV